MRRPGTELVPAFVGAQGERVGEGEPAGSRRELGLQHERAVQRCVQAGAVPMTWIQVLLELQRDWARQDTYVPVLDVAMQHGGAYGVGIRYAKAILGEHANEGGR